MNAQNTILNIAVSFAFILAACGGDSGNNASNDELYSSPSTEGSNSSTNPDSQGNTQNPTSQNSSTISSSSDNLNYSGITYKTYEGLVSEQPCDLTLNLTIAHVSSTNEDYLCSQDAASGIWSWQPYQGGNGTVIGEDGRVYETFTDSRDGHVYKKVTIGSQTWMAENLNFATEASYCFRDYYSGIENCNKDRYYTWSDAMDSVGRFSENGKGWGRTGTKYLDVLSPIYPVRGICPQGWHLPDTTEWNTLIQYVGNPPYGIVSITNSNKFKGATNSYGFSAKSTGHWYAQCYSCNDDGPYIIYWSSTPFISSKMLTDAYQFKLVADGVSFPEAKNGRSDGVGADVASIVRCIED